jgi:uncharacterized protein with HEPN domain
MRPEKLYLGDIPDAADAIERFLRGVDQDNCLLNEILQSAVLQKMIVIGEAAARISDEYRERHPEVEWSDIVGFRNFVVHAYFSIRWHVVWKTATESVPELRRKIAATLASEGW